jgi:hypothetical protein
MASASAQTATAICASRAIRCRRSLTSLSSRLTLRTSPPSRHRPSVRPRGEHPAVRATASALIAADEDTMAERIGATHVGTRRYFR